MTKDKTITVKLSDLHLVCHACGRVKPSTCERTYRTKNYRGGCGDSFCWATCDSSSCKPVRERVCSDCARTGTAPPVIP